MRFNQFARQLLFSPLKLVGLLVLCAFCFELLIMALLHNLADVSPLSVFLLDAFLLSCALSLVMCFLLFRPLKHLIVQYQSNETFLEGHKEHLEIEVRARTATLDTVVQKLRKKITEHDQMKVALHNNKDFLEAILESISSPLFYKDRNGRYLGCNSAFSSFLGLSKAQIIGATVFDVAPGELARTYHQADLDLIESRDTQMYQAQVRYADGSLRDIVFNKSVILHHDGQIGGLVGVMLDVTRIKQTEESLRVSETKYRNIFNNAEIGIFRSRLDGVELMEVNQKFLEIVGWTREDAVGKPFGMFWETAEECERLLRRLAAEGRVLGFECSLLNSRAGVRTCLASVVLYGEQEILEGTIVDITDYRTAEREKRQLEAQLHQAQKMEAVGHLAGGVAHDFNNMLVVIAGHAELALMKLLPSHPYYENFCEIRSAADRSTELTRQLLAFARKQPIAPKVIDLNESVVDMYKMLQRLIGEEIHLDWHPASDLWPVKADPTQVNQILANLCVNARDAIAGVGRITIETANSIFDVRYCATHAYVEPGEYVRLTVIDDGVGMDKETLTRVFEPFFTTKKLGEGTGLGLATVYGIVKQNHGFINVYSEPGYGATFTIYLPRDLGQNDNVQQRIEVIAEPIPRGVETILLAEDEPSVLELTSAMLEGQGYTVLKAETATEARRLFMEQTGGIHLLMTDLILPDMNGYDLHQELSGDGPPLKCLFMSGYPVDAVGRYGLNDDDIHFIQKPFSLLTVAGMLRDILDTP